MPRAYVVAVAVVVLAVAAISAALWRSERGSRIEAQKARSAGLAELEHVRSALREVEKARSAGLTELDHVRSALREAERDKAESSRKAAELEVQIARARPPVGPSAIDAYAARILLARDKVNGRAFRLAELYLTSCPPELRGWAWGRLWASTRA